MYRPRKKKDRGIAGNEKVALLKGGKTAVSLEMKKWHCRKTTVAQEERHRLAGQLIMISKGRKGKEVRSSRDIKECSLPSRALIHNSSSR